MSAVPAWLPDEATLTRLASEFFGALPGPDAATAFPANPADAGIPDPPGAGFAAGPGAGFPAGSSAPVPVGSGAEFPVRHGAARPLQSGVALPSYPGIEFPVLPGLGLPVRPSAALPGYQPAVAAPGDPAGAAALVPSFYFVNELPPAAGPQPAIPADSKPVLDVEAIRRDFPILRERVHGRQLVWLDNAATTQKPQAVIDRLAYFYAHENSNIHRAAHALAARATDAYEDARSTVADFIGASSSDDIVFTRGTTEAINLVAQAWGRQFIGRDDEIVISYLEHHANIVPWQQLAEQTGAKLKVIPVDDDGQVLLDAYAGLLSDRTRLVSIAHVSNVLGTIVPVKEVIEAAHRSGARVLVDGAQSVAHIPTDVRAMGTDFYVFSGHKIYAPTGIGVLYAKPEVLAEMPPWQGGGNMISDVTFERTAYQQPPAKFEAGTGNIADAVGLGAALEYVTLIGLSAVASYEHQLLEYATAEICTVPGLQLIGVAPEKTSVLTFVLDGYEPADVGKALDRQGIAVRAGHHCAQPILRRYGLETAVRASLAMYNTCAEIDLLVAALRRLAADIGHR